MQSKSDKLLLLGHSTASKTDLVVELTSRHHADPFDDRHTKASKRPVVGCCLVLLSCFVVIILFGSFCKLWSPWTCYQSEAISFANTVPIVGSSNQAVDGDDELGEIDELDDTSFSNLMMTSSGKQNTADGQAIVTIGTKFGPVSGVEMVSRQGRTYYGFLRIPYAKPPTGRRRFRPPEPIFRWSGTLNATVLPSECIQKVKYSAKLETAGEEDCLYMSIYIPRLPSKDQSLLPVMFYIHGGGLTDGNGTRYGAKYFMDEDVVLITFQYRLGPLGFLNSADGDIKGNMGFKDQVMAMKFVRRIIEDFGGDNSKIAIFGNSAGGMSVSNLVLSPLSNGLFQRAITQSGAAIGANSYDKHPEKTAAIVAKRFNCTYGTDAFPKRKLSRCLRNVSASDIALVREGTKYGLTIEAESDGAFMVESPLDVLRFGRTNNVTWIIGVNSAEDLTASLSFLKQPDLIKSLNQDWPKYGPTLFHYNSTAIDPDSMSYRVRDFFFGSKNVSNDTQSNLTALCSDGFMIHGSKVQATYHAQNFATYTYYLTKRPAKSYADAALKGFPPGDYGVAHADELQYLFLYDGYPEYNTSSEYYNFSKAMVKTWASFANGALDPAWLPYKPKVQEQWYNLDDVRKMTDAIVGRMKFWDSFPAEDLFYT